MATPSRNLRDAKWSYIYNIEVDCRILRPFSSFSLKCFSANLTTVMVLITRMAEPCGQNVSGKFSPVANLRERRRWWGIPLPQPSDTSSLTNYFKFQVKSHNLGRLQPESVLFTTQTWKLKKNMGYVRGLSGKWLNVGRCRQWPWTSPRSTNSARSPRWCLRHRSCSSEVGTKAGLNRWKKKFVPLTSKLIGPL